MNVHLGLKIFFTQMVQKYSELYLAVPPPTPAHCRLPPQDRFVIYICVTCRWILDLKK
jgi:hypothetical protein